MNNSGHLFENKCSLVLNLNPRWSKTSLTTTVRNNTTDKAGAKAKAPEPPPLGVSYKNLTIGVPKEIYKNERRVAITPAVVQTLTKKGFKILVEENAGALAQFPNDQYEAAGAKVTDAKGIFTTSDILLKVRAPEVSVSTQTFVYSKNVDIVAEPNGTEPYRFHINSLLR